VKTVCILREVQNKVIFPNTSYSVIIGCVLMDESSAKHMGEEQSAKKKTHVMTLRIPDKLYSSILKRSEGENRSRSNLILTYLHLIIHLSPEELKTVIDGRKRRSKGRNGR